MLPCGACFSYTLMTVTSFRSRGSYFNCAFLPPATKLGQGNIFRSVCQQFCPRGGMRGCPGGVHGFIWGACVVLFGGRMWFYSAGGHAWFYSVGACMVLFRGHVWFYSVGVCVVLFSRGMHGFIQRGVCMVLFGGACVVLFSGGHAWFYSAGGPVWFYSVGGMRGFIQGGHAWFFQFFRIQ